MREKKSILVVEDEPLVAKTLIHLLSLWGYSPLSVQKGREAVEATRRGAYDLILLDNSLPDLPAFLVLERFKRDRLTAYQPIILLIEKKALRKGLIENEIHPDDYLIKPIDPLELRLRIGMILHRTEHQLQANPMTRLPGTLTIEKEIETRLLENAPLSVCYYDIDHFKAFNDVYGYYRGNAVLHQTARLIVDVVQEYGNDSDLVGHIGGDDFIVLTTPDKEEAVCLHSVQEFDRLIPFQYRDEDRKRGSLSVRNRMGKTQQFPLISLSIAVVDNRSRALESVLHVSEVASEIKKFLKERSQPQSAYFVDRRTGDPKGKEARTTPSASLPILPKPRKTHKPLGQLLLDSNLIHPHQLEEALMKHWRGGRHLGQILLETKLIDLDTLGSFLSEQMNVPYVKIERYSLPKELKENLPHEWLREHGVFPLEKKGTNLSLAMVNPLDQKIIQWVEQKTGCLVKPYLTIEGELEQHLDRLEHQGQHG